MSNHGTTAQDWLGPTPFTIDIVFDLILQYVGSNSRYLLPCRAVCLSWHSRVTKMLIQAGWRLRLSNANVEEYMCLLRETNCVSRLAGHDQRLNSPDYKMDIRLELDCATLKTNCQRVLTAAIEIVKEREGTITDLEVAVGRPTPPPELMQLISRTSETIRHLSVQFLAPIVPESSLVSAFGCLPYGLWLLSLESFYIEYNKLCYQAVELTKQLKIRAPKLNCVRIQRRQTESEYRQEPVDILGSFGSNDIENLVELQVSLGDLVNMTKIEDVTFHSLRTLRVTCHGHLGMNMGDHSLTSILARNAPALQSLEIVDVTPSNHTLYYKTSFIHRVLAHSHRRRGPDVRVHALPTLIHLGCSLSPFLNPRHREDTHRSHGVIKDGEVTLDLMRGSPYLTQITTNFETWMTLAYVYKNLTREVRNERAQPAGVPQLFQDSKRPGVKSLTISVARRTIQSESELIPTIGMLVKVILPNLKELLVNLIDEDTDEEERADDGDEDDEDSALKHVLALVFAIQPVKSVWTNNYTNNWTMVHGLGATCCIPSVDSNPSDPALFDPEPQKTSLSISLRAAKRRGGEPAPNFCLCKYLALIPTNWDVEAQIDSDLLLGSGCHCVNESSYEAMLEKVRGMSCYFNRRIGVI